MLIPCLLFLQVLNEFFHNVCELDLVFNFYKVSASYLKYELEANEKSVKILTKH